MKKRIIAALMVVAMTAGMMAGCTQEQAKEQTSSKSENKVKLDPENPVSLTIWHYYNGARQATFDGLIDKFNNTVGKEEGIYVEGYSLGSVSDLESSINDAIEGKVGAKELPDVFSTYADTAYNVQAQDKLADLSEYFTQDELDKYVDNYIEEGYLNGDDKLYLFPIAKSTEIMMINKTAWEPFANETGTDISELATTEGVTAVAKKYYEWSGGKAFYGRDSMSNYFVIGMKQMGKEIFETKDGKVTINTDRNLIHRLWENYYVPYVKGYFAAFGKFRSDDVKTGDIVAYTGSTSSVMYFPDKVETDDGSQDIDYIVLNAPIMENGQNVRVQQGAGMAVTKSDKAHEYAACEFLKWITQKEHNYEFVCDSGYMPVLKEANNIEALDETIKEENIEVPDKVYDCLKCVMDNLDDVSFYTTKSFKNGYSVRSILDYSLSDRAVADKQAIDDAVENGASRETEEAKYTSEDSFESWYEEFCDALTKEAAK